MGACKQLWHAIARVEELFPFPLQEGGDVVSVLANSGIVKGSATIASAEEGFQMLVMASMSKIRLDDVRYQPCQSASFYRRKTEVNEALCCFVVFCSICGSNCCYGTCTSSTKVKLHKEKELGIRRLKAPSLPILRSKFAAKSSLHPLIHSH